MSTNEATKETLQESIESMLVTVKRALVLKKEIITLQEKLIEELSEQNEKMTNRVKNSFRAGFLFGFAVAVIVCSIINIVIAAIR